MKIKIGNIYYCPEAKSKFVVKSYDGTCWFDIQWQVNGNITKDLCVLDFRGDEKLITDKYNYFNEAVNSEEFNDV